MRRGRLPTTAAASINLDGPEGPSGRNASPSGITPSTILSPAGRTARSRTEIGLGARAHTPSASTTPVKRYALGPNRPALRVTERRHRRSKRHPRFGARHRARTQQHNSGSHTLDQGAPAQIGSGDVRSGGDDRCRQRGSAAAPSGTPLTGGSSSRGCGECVQLARSGRPSSGYSGSQLKEASSASTPSPGTWFTSRRIPSGSRNESE
jgi:hypothetical protein